MEVKFKKIAEEIAELVAEKNKAYGDSFGRAGEVIRILYPNEISPEQYEDMLVMIRVIDKLFRIATFKKAFEEDPWVDIMGYALLAVSRNQKNKEN